eukprot:CAMPEP_0171101566 /NCGR_PEP_ID=MMETSP0766_2-20121228/55397_1 /TAXON_ID=439317 /ORGANISM="Gambierdiscus australes, Strain CAWD 149" /LENGTH=328 /DNA_ID=CAMNT_0011561645 /DNA_START=75 /DNA_END=1061 /DNA_ORIENTATION=-
MARAQTVSQLCEGMEDDSEEVRKVAQETLIEAYKGDFEAISEVSRRLEHMHPEVRKGAVDTLTHLAGRGNVHAVAEVSRRLGHWYANTRRSAIEALVQVMVESQHGKVSDLDDHNIIDEVIALLEDEQPDVRETAVWALGQVAHSGDQNTITAVCLHLEHKEPHVRRAAVQALVEIYRRGESIAVLALCEAAQHTRPEVRQAALEALSQVALQGDPQAVAVAQSRMEDWVPEVRRAAAQALGQLAVEGDSNSVAALEPCTQEMSRADVKRAAADAVCALSPKAKNSQWPDWYAGPWDKLGQKEEGDANTMLPPMKPRAAVRQAMTRLL